MRNRVFVACCALSLIHASFGAAQERYYAVLFASGNGPVRLSHSFATFLKTETADVAGGPGQPVESFTISWMPASGTLRILGGPVQGRNFTLQESLAWANQRGLPTRTWGPFEIAQKLYDRAAKQKRRLESGAVAYKLLDRLGGAQAIGPILVGMAQPVHVLQRGPEVNEIVNMAVIAAVDAQEHGRVARRSH